MTTETTNQPALEPEYLFRQRTKAALEKAVAEAEAAKQAEAAAFAAVDHARGESAIGRLARGDVLKSQRALARAQENAATAAAKVRAVERATARELDARLLVERDEARRRHEELVRVANASRVRRRAIWVELSALIDELDHLEGLAPLSQMARWREAVDLIGRVRRAHME
jgi:hypothetical protein